MKKTTKNASKNNSKISDFFTKLTNNESHDNKNCDNKRKLSEIVHPENTVLNRVTNLPTKSDHSLSPTHKKVKHDENCIPTDELKIDSYVRTTVQDMCHNTQQVKFVNERSVNLFNDNYNVSNTSEDISPSKYKKSSALMRTPTPKKNKTLQGSKKGTPKKLFEKSPRKLEEFDVQVLKNFVQISPNTSNKIIRVKCTPDKSYTNMKNISPSLSNKNIYDQSYKTTSSKSPNHFSKTVSPRIREKLEFSEKICQSTLNDSQKDKQMDDNGEADFDAAFYSMFNDEFNVVEEKLNELSFDESQHCTILEVERSAGRILLKLKSNKSRDVGVCSIEEFWSSSNNFKVGDSIYIKAVKTSDGKWVVNNQSGWLIYEPNLLISCTSIVGSLFCKRKSVLSERFRGFEPGNRVMLIGVLIHTLLQNVLRHKLKTADEIETTLNNMLKSEDIIKKLYECDLTFSDIKPELQSFIPRILEFIDQYVNGGNSTNPEAKKNWKGKICGIDDIEENILCPELGIKGKIDVTVKTESNMMPLELKTGRATVSLEHRGQVMLYIMMMSKLGYKISSGLLLYLREGVLKEIKATPQEKRDIMILRNELAYYLTRNTIKSSSDVLMKPPELPEPINHHSACAKCSYNVICTSFLKFNNYDLSKNKALQEVQNDATAHLTEAHLSYFIHWVTLLSMEQGSSFDAKHLSDIYTVEPTKRELRGGCIINVKVVSAGVECNGLFEHVFKKDDFCESINLASYGITENNYVVISTANRPGVAAGFVTGISTSTVTIVLDRNLNEKYHGKLFHVDTYDTNITQSFNLTSVALLLENTPRAAQLRNTIIDKTAPTFASKLPSVVAKKGGPILRRLNHVQQKAVLKALCAKEFLLIKGMPGTGKTATIVALVQLLLELNKTVLITSHTHSAIDNICIRLQKYGIEFLRLGSESRIDKNLKSRSEASLTKGCTTPEQLQETYNSFKVIAVTCLGSNHPLLSKRSLDFCIVDESTQVLQTSVIRPLSVAKTFVLIGDPDQLAPVVKNRAAANAGMTETLFERLSVNADGIISLNLSYRMNKIITNLANVLTYKGQLQTANDHVANKTLAVPNIECVKSSYQDSPWLLKALDTSLEASVRFIDTGPVWQLPQNSGKFFKNYAFLDNLDTDNFINVHEIVIVATLVNALIKGGVTSSDIGVIATYRAQVAQISALLSEKNVDVSTVDQFQGRDKSVVIYSCTKSKDMSKTSSDTQKFELLQDQRRLTVAITRAKHKLLIVGDSSTLQHYATFSTILEALGKDNIIRFNSDWTILNEFIDLQ